MPLCAGGANVPALNDLLWPFGMAFGDASLVGTLSVAGEYSSASILNLFCDVI